VGLIVGPLAVALFVAVITRDASEQREAARPQPGPAPPH